MIFDIYLFRPQCGNMLPTSITIIQETEYNYMKHAKQLTKQFQSRNKSRPFTEIILRHPKLLNFFSDYMITNISPLLLTGYSI